MIVTDDSLTQCVSDQRRALGNRANYVLWTLPGRGYMLGEEVEKQSADLAPLSSSVARIISEVDPETIRRELVLIERVSTSNDDAGLVGGIWDRAVSAPCPLRGSTGGSSQR